MDAHAQELVSVGAKSDGAKPGAPAGIGSTSSSGAAQEKRRHIGSTSFQQFLKNKLLQSTRNAWFCPSSFVSSLTAAFVYAVFIKP